MQRLRFIALKDFVLESGKLLDETELSYEVFGKALNSGSPIVLVCHALTGNSTLTGEKGWWNGIIGINKPIDLERFCVVGFNIPGNGYERDPKRLIGDYHDFTVRDIARLFATALMKLGVEFVDYAIGGSLGGGICWEITVTYPNYVGKLISVASDWKASDWVLAHNKVQSQILENSSNPLHDARMMAMMFYRTPESFKMKFNRTQHSELHMFNVESWLLHHGQKLVGRFYLQAYKLMNNLLSTLDITKGRGSFEDVASTITAQVVLVGINSDLFFSANENRETVELLKQNGCKARYYEIDSIHGHDGFLIEFEQMCRFLTKELERQGCVEV